MHRHLQYLHLDFLRLFRLSRRLKYVNKKRKMPSQYVSHDEGILCCKRMMKSFLIKVFPGDIGKVKTSGTEFHITFNKELNDLFAFFTACPDSFFTTHNKNEEWKGKLRFLLGGRDNYVRSFLTLRYDKSIRFSTTNWSSYQPYRHYDRLPFKFYETALAVIEFKKIWDELVPELIQLKNYSECSIKQKEELKKETKPITIVKGHSIGSTLNTNDTTTSETQSQSVSIAQRNFNEALSRYLRTNIEGATS